MERHKERKNKFAFQPSLYADVGYRFLNQFHNDAQLPLYFIL